MSSAKRIFTYPPSELSTWQALEPEDRLAWLVKAASRFTVGGEGRHDVSTVPGRAIRLDGRLIDGLSGFLCAFGEAVNGPGGYFGRSFHAFDDCLFGGFGLEAPYAIRWEHHEASRASLGPHALLNELFTTSREMLIRVIGVDPEGDFGDGVSPECQAWRASVDAARRGEVSLFDEIVDAIRSVPDRGGGPVSLVLA